MNITMLKAGRHNAKSGSGSSSGSWTWSWSRSGSWPLDDASGIPPTNEDKGGQNDYG